ncbi:hypothetical protein CC86DRAFT_381944 [Ophiobolus disseminans]|uniref:Uncharacterized protein n=1 Tax=Ophiobolus disseminans TaxID=1469910 RepID=A0A6A7A264_9PLEO|nr:hypothetical protein CC86DRAFT_381944 [Ophiobolus disseminans]
MPGSTNNGTTRAPRTAINVDGELSSRVQDNIPQNNNITAAYRRNASIGRSIAASNDSGYTTEDSDIERHSFFLERRNAVPLIAPLPRSPAIMHFPAALEEQAVLAYEQNPPSPPPPYTAERPSDGPCARCLESGEASTCRRGFCRILSDRELNVSPLQDTWFDARSSPVSPVSPMSEPASMSHRDPLPSYVSRVALTDFGDHLPDFGTYALLTSVDN